MLINGSITRIDTPATPDLAGTVAYVQGSAIEVDCFLGDVSLAQKWGLGETVADASAVAYAGRDDIKAAGGIGPKSRLLAAIDGETPALYEIVHHTIRTLGSIDLYVIYLEVL